MREKIIAYIRAGYPGLYLVSPEEQRVEAELKAVAHELVYRLYAWSAMEGLLDTTDGTVRPVEDPLAMIGSVAELPDNSLVLLRDFHVFLEDANPVLVRAMKEELTRCKTRGKVLVVLGCRQVLPPELERELTVVPFALPGKRELATVLDAICTSAQLPLQDGETRELILDAATGMTCTEAENAFALSVIERKGIDAAVVAREKAQTVKKSGLLEIVEAGETLADIGGLDVLKNWLLQRRQAFGERARAYGLPQPKGVLLLGVPGTGKSLTAKVAAHVLERPLLKLDIGALMGSLVGESEANLRAAIRVAEAIAPCIVWVDELDKGLSGSRSSGSTDGGTSARVFGGFISWMQDKTSPVFVVATANDVSQLPPELLRKGRFDELFFVDLPSEIEREAIWRIHIARRGRDPERLDLRAFVKLTDGFTGSEIEQVVVDALFDSFDDGRELDTQAVILAIESTVPLSTTMAEDIKQLRKWAGHRARSASQSERTLPTSRRIAA